MVKSGILVLNPNSFMKPIICFIPDFPYAFPANFTYGKRSIAPYLSTCFALCVIHLCITNSERRIYFGLGFQSVLGWPLPSGEEENIVVDRYGERGCSSHDSQESSETGKGHEQVCIFPVLLHHFPVMSSYYESVHVQLSSPHPRKGLSVSP